MPGSQGLEGIAKKEDFSDIFQFPFNQAFAQKLDTRRSAGIQ